MKKKNETHRMMMLWIVALPALLTGCGNPNSRALGSTTASLLSAPAGQELASADLTGSLDTSLGLDYDDGADDGEYGDSKDDHDGDYDGEYDVDYGGDYDDYGEYGEYDDEKAGYDDYGDEGGDDGRYCDLGDQIGGGTSGYSERDVANLASP